MPDDQQPPRRALQRLHGSVSVSGPPGTVIPSGFPMRVERPDGSSVDLVTVNPSVVPSSGESVSVGVEPGETRHTAMQENFRRIYGWHNESSRIMRATPLPHNTPHLDRSEPRPTFNARRVTVPMFEIASNPTISLSDISRRRFNLTDDRRIAASNEVQSILDALVKTFGRAPPEPEAPRPELPRRSRWEVLAA